MTTITITLNERSKAGKAFMAMADFFRELKVIEIVENEVELKNTTEKVSGNIPNEVTLQSMEKTRNGIGLTRSKDTKDLMEKLLS
jgi:antitoxin component of RelBE/YafQ-DinJ toxin-antitoxin module